MSEMNKPEPRPLANEGTPIWDLVIADMRERDRIGREQYGTPLQAWNGRKPLVDAYQEALDLAVYLRQEIEERKALGEKVARLERELAAIMDALGKVGK